VFVPQPLDALLWDAMLPDLEVNLGIRPDEITHLYTIEDGTSPEAVDYGAGLCLDKAPLPPVKGAEALGLAVNGLAVNGIVIDDDDDDDGEGPEDEE
jgi:hypothetical protein